MTTVYVDGAEIQVHLFMNSGCVCLCRTSVLLTVAGDATSRSTGSKMRLICGDIWIISPLIRHSFLLSSSTVFMFSIHTASTGPSKISHFLSGLYWTQEELEFITIHLMWEKKKHPIIISITSYLSDRFILTTADFFTFHLRDLLLFYAVQNIWALKSIMLNQNKLDKAGLLFIFRSTNPKFPTEKTRLSMWQHGWLVLTAGRTDSHETIIALKTLSSNTPSCRYRGDIHYLYHCVCVFHLVTALHSLLNQQSPWKQLTDIHSPKWKDFFFFLIKSVL